MCVPKDKMCDGVVDCDNGADEKGCCKFLLHRNSDLKCVSTVDDQLNGDQINGFDQINGQKGYDDQL